MTVIINQGVMPPTSVVKGTRFRTNEDLDDEFLDSIREKGIIQPITIDQNKTLVAGGRRLAAALKLELTEIPYIQRQVDTELDLRECELIENLYRKDLTWIDNNNLVNKIHQLMEQKHGNNWSQRKTAEMLNKSVGGINRHLALNKAISHFPALAQCKTEDEAVKLFRKVSERAIVKDLVKQQAARVATPETATSAETAPLPVGVRLASGARDHYRIGDAIKGMQELADKGIVIPCQLVEIDPPYGIDLTSQKKGEDNEGLGEYNEIESKDYDKFLFNTISLVAKVTPPNCRFIIWFGIEWYQYLRDILLTLDIKHDLIPGIWNKGTGQTAAPDLYLGRAYETFIVAWKGDPIPIVKRGRSNVFNYPPEPYGNKYHPTQRPVALMQELLHTYAWPGSVILVPFLGSGATLRTAYQCGMSGFGWDLSEVYKEGFIAQIEKDIQDGSLNEVLEAKWGF